MTNLPQYTLIHKNSKWVLQNDMTNTVARTFKSKAYATMRGVLERSLGSDGGLVRIKNVYGATQEERTYPRNRLQHDSPA
jgi:hypothetical protein